MTADPILQPLTDSRGFPQREWIESLSPDQLKDWVRKRLAGRDPYFGLFEELETRGELFVHLTNAWPLSDPLAERLGRIVEDLAADVVRQETPDVPTFVETLDLYGELSAAQYAGSLVEVIETPRWSSSYWHEHQLDVRLLASLSRKTNSLGVGFWEQWLNDPRYCEVALAAIQDFYGWEKAAESLAQAMPLFRQHASDMNLALTLDYLLRSGVSAASLAKRLRSRIADPNDWQAACDACPQLPSESESVEEPAGRQYEQQDLVVAFKCLLPSIGEEQAKRCARGSLVRRRGDPKSLEQARQLDCAV